MELEFDVFGITKKLVKHVVHFSKNYYFLNYLSFHKVPT
jgi:hypothetical protein